MSGMLVGVLHIFFRLSVYFEFCFHFLRSGILVGILHIFFRLSVYFIENVECCILYNIFYSPTLVVCHSVFLSVIPFVII